MLVDPQAPPKDSHRWKGVPAIKKWSPRHDQVLAMHLAGYQNQVIAEKLGYTDARVSQILSDPRAEKALRRIRQRLAEKSLEEIETTIPQLARESLDRVATTIRADIPATSKAKPHQDRAAFKVLEMAGYGAKQKDDDRGSGGIQLSPEAEHRLVSAMEKSVEADKIHELEEGEDFFVTEED